MKRHARATALLAALLSTILPAAASADFIDPASVVATIDPGQTLTIQKTVTVTSAPPMDAPVDIFFLVDTTGTMGVPIESFQAGSAAILAGVSGLGDIQYGVGRYEDFPISPFGTPIDSPYTRVQDMTASEAATLAAINSLDMPLGQGGDIPEANLFALSQVATTTSFRADSTRIVVWFGDAPGHDPAVELYPGGVTRADSIAALMGENIVVEALDVSPNPGDGLGLNECSVAFTCPGLGLDGQASEIASLTGGDLFLGVDGTNVNAVVDAVVQSITGAIFEYSEVSLEIVGDTDNTDVTITPLSVAGVFDRSVDREFVFQMEVTGASAGIDEFTVRAMVDGAVVAVETDRITVTPEPGSVAVFGLGSLLVGAALRRRPRR